MYAGDLINNEPHKKITRYYFAKMGKQVRVTEYETCFTVKQLFGDGKMQVADNSKLDMFLEGMKESANLIETIRYK